MMLWHDLCVVKLRTRACEKGSAPGYLDMQDIYAKALNNVPPCYVQEMSVKLRDPVSDGAVRQAVREAVDMVLSHPSC